MPDMPEVLDKRVGPFPVVGWLAIGAAGIGLAIVIRRSELFGGSGEVAPVDAVDEEYGDPAAAGQLYTYGTLPTTVPVAPQTQPQPARPSTNAAWRSEAVRWAIGAGHDPVAAESAVGHYLAGSQMTYAQGIVLRAIIGALGPAPEGAPVPDIAAQPPATAPPGTTTTTPPTAKPPAVASYHVHRIGEVGKRYPLRSIAYRFAVTKNGDAVEAMLRRIVTANPTLKGQTSVAGGFALRVPTPHDDRG